jgi:hypothetical protein
MKQSDIQLPPERLKNGDSFRSGKGQLVLSLSQCCELFFRLHIPLEA